MERHHNLLGRGVMRSAVLAAFIVVILDLSSAAVRLTPKTVAAFDRSAAVAEDQMAGELNQGKFLRLDSLTAHDRDAIILRLKKGEVITERLEILDRGQRIAAPGGLIHVWVGTVFVPGATLARTLAFLQDYDHSHDFYAPEIQRSRLVRRDGNQFHVFFRLQETKVATITLNTEYDVKYTQLDADHAFSTSRSTRITEVQNPGRPDETDKPEGDDGGFLWRLNSYWRFRQGDGGVYVQLEAISLTRDIPIGLGWLIKPFITSIPNNRWHLHSAEPGTA